MINSNASAWVPTFKWMTISGISLLRQMMVEGLIRKDIEEYGLLKLTEKGKAFLKKPYSLKIIVESQVSGC
jgi:predicted transcriptional regulator